MIYRVIVWGYKFSNYHTHSHIHSSYYKAFKHMGFDTYWLGDDDILETNDFKNTLFFTSGDFATTKIPLIKDAPYILHNSNNDKYLQAGCKVLNMYNYVKYCEEGISFNHKETGNTVEKISDLLFFDKAAPAIYQPWATDLLPHEIDIENPCLYDPNKKIVNYVGSIWGENIKQITPFIQACKDNGIEFKHYAGGISDEDNKKLIRESYIAPDIRGEWHIECGYIPCRIFKNISYGQITGINSPHVYKLFGDMIAYNSNTYDLFNSCVEKGKTTTLEELKESMLAIKEYHTYINRIENIFYILARL